MDGEWTHQRPAAFLPAFQTILHPIPIPPVSTLTSNSLDLWATLLFFLSWCYSGQKTLVDAWLIGKTTLFEDVKLRGSVIQICIHLTHHAMDHNTSNRHVMTVMSKPNHDL